MEPSRWQIDNILGIEELSIATAQARYAVLWAAAKEMFGLSDKKTAKVVSLVVGTCPHCYENSEGCVCSRDD